MIGSRGKGELHQARELLDQKLGQDDSAIVVLLRDAEWQAVRDMFRRFDAEPLILELTPEAEQGIAALTADEEVAQSVRAEIDIVDHTAK